MDARATAADDEYDDYNPLIGLRLPRPSFVSPSDDRRGELAEVSPLPPSVPASNLTLERAAAWAQVLALPVGVLALLVALAGTLRMFGII